MSSSHAPISPRFVAGILAAGVLVLAGAFTSTAGANTGHHPLAHHARRHHPRCGARHRRAHHRRCAKTAVGKHRQAHRLRVIHAAVATPATVPSGPCPNAELMPAAADLEQVRTATLCLINKIRMQHGEPPLRESTALDTVAYLHSASMVEGDYFNHTTPSGEAFDARIAAAGYVPSGSSYELGENIECATLNLATPAATVNGWMNSPEHRANILDGDFRDSGIGVVASVPAMFADGQPGATYTQDFGVVISS